jgi:hypothetical protein
MNPSWKRRQLFTGILLAALTVMTIAIAYWLKIEEVKELRYEKEQQAHSNPLHQASSK